jgi:hypothetical protein
MTSAEFGWDKWTRAVSVEEFWDAHGGCILNTRCCGMDWSRAKDRPRVQLRVRHLSKSRDPNRRGPRKSKFGRMKSILLNFQIYFLNCNAVNLRVLQLSMA